MNSKFQKVNYSQKKNTNLGAGLLVIYLLIPTLISIIFLNLIQDSNLGLVLGMFVGFLLYILIAFSIFKELRVYTKGFFRNEVKNDIKRNVFILALILVFYYLVSFVLNILIALIYMAYTNGGFLDFWNQPSSSNQESIVNILQNEKVSISILGFFSVVILAPIVEELAFREGIFKLNSNPKIAVIISTVVFGVLHVAIFSNPSDLWYLPFYLLIGFCFSTIYWLTNYNYIYSTSAHAIVNFISYIILLSN